MRKIIFFATVILFLSLASAVEDGFSVGSGSTFVLSETISNHQKAKNIDELNFMILQNQEILNSEIINLNENQKLIFENQNKVRNAAYSLLSMESLLPSVGIIVSNIAKELNNSVQTTINAEEKIKERNSFAYFLVGGDLNSAKIIESEIIFNQQRISDLKELSSRCGCAEQIKNIFDEQIQIIENEESRLREIANYEKNNSGLFGWIFRF